MQPRYGSPQNVRHRCDSDAEHLRNFTIPKTFRSQRKTLLPKVACVQFFKDCLAEGLIAMSYSPRVRIHPPLVITADEATEALAILDAALARIM